MHVKNVKNKGCSFGCCPDVIEEHQVVGDIVIPAPTREDLEWKEKLEKSREDYDFDRSRSWYDTDVFNVTSLWRVKYLLENRKAIDKSGGRALYNAVKDNNEDLTRLLILEGADVNLSNALHLRRAAVEGDTASFDRFIQLNADIELAFAHADAETLQALAAMTGQKAQVWQKQDDQSILRRHYEQDSDTVYTIRTLFNFESRRIKIYTTKGEKELAPRHEFFRDQETLKEIDEAYEKLLALQGKPTPPQNYVLTGKKDNPSPSPGNR